MKSIHLEVTDDEFAVLEEMRKVGPGKRRRPRNPLIADIFWGSARFRKAAKKLHISRADQQRTVGRPPTRKDTNGKEMTDTK